PRLPGRRAARAARRTPLAPARFRAPPGPARAPPDATSEPARLGSTAVSGRRLFILPLLFCLLGAFFAATSAGGTKPAVPTTISFGVTEDATKYSEDGGAFYFSTMADLGMKEDRVIVFWDENTPSKILEQPFIDRMMPVAAVSGIRLVLVIQPIHAFAFATNTQARIAAYAAYVRQVAL